MNVIEVIALALLAWTLILSGLTALLFFHDNINAYGLRGMAERTALSPSGQTLRLLGLSWLSQVIVTLTFPLGWFRSLWFRPPEVAIRQPGGLRYGTATRRPPVLLVHGLYHNAGGWLLFRRRLKQAGFAHLFAYSYSSFFQDFFQLTKLLSNKVEELRAHFPGTKVVLVGHSLGGLLVRAYMASPQSRGKIAAAVTLGAPHQGSRLAALGLGGLARSLAHRGPLVQALEQADQPADAPCLSLAAPLDEFVLPLEAALLPRAGELGWVQRSTRPTTHIMLLYDPAVAQAAVAFLDAALSGQ